jgi:hypothetical protein
LDCIIIQKAGAWASAFTIGGKPRCHKKVL